MTWTRTPAVLVAALLLASAIALVAYAKPQPKTHLGGKGNVSAMVELLGFPATPVYTVTEFNVVNPDGTDGGLFTLAEGEVFVLLDYVASGSGGLLSQICQDPCVYLDRFSTRVDLNNAVERNATGIVFSTVPKILYPSGNNPLNAYIKLYGCIAKDR